MITFDARNREPCKVGGSSKGCQLKFFDGSMWFKVDSVGYEGFAEVVASRLATLLNVNMPVVSYSLCTISLPTGESLGCCSKSFVGSVLSETTAKRMLQQAYGNHWVSHVYDKMSPKDKLDILCSLLKEIDCRLVDQLACMFQFDALIRNLDRHLNNIVLRVCPVYSDIILFDNGDSCTADITYDYPKESTLDDCLKVTYAKPLSISFEQQCALMSDYSSFKLKALNNRIELSDLKEYVPDWFYTRVCAFLKYQFKNVLNCDLIIL